VGSTNVELLRKHPLMARLNEEQLTRFGRAGDLELFKQGEDIVVAGTLGDSMYLILAGSATVHAPGGGAPLAKLKAGEFFGEMSLLEPALRSATVRASETCELYRLPHFSLANLLQDDPQAMHAFMLTIVRVLSERLRQTNKLVGDVKRLSEFLASSII
jgi:CRP-like cAMP-binding protein